MINIVVNKNYESGKLLLDYLIQQGVESRISTGEIEEALNVNFSSREVRGINGYPVPKIMGNKVLCRRIWRDAGLPVPEFWEDPAEIPVGVYPLIGRPSSHSEGKHIYVCNNIKEVQNSTRGDYPATHWMRIIWPNKEFRVLSCLNPDGKFVSKRLVEKIFQDPPADFEYKFYPKNYKFGSVFLYPEIPDEEKSKIRSMAGRGMRAISSYLGDDSDQLYFGAVDLIQDSNGKLYLLEVNSKFGMYGDSTPRIFGDYLRSMEK